MSVTESGRRPSYAVNRRIVMLVGLAILLIVAGVTYYRAVDPKEVAATLLFIPIFVALIFGRLPAGVVVGILAAVVYAAIRYPDIQAVGLDRYSSLLVSRGLAFVAFGAVGGWASKQLDASVAKLELYDQVDDTTGLLNARFFLQDTDLEMTRAVRYKTVFSVGVVDVPAAIVKPLSKRQKAGLLKELGRLLSASVRSVDRPVYAFDGTRHRLAVVLPETSKEGANVFTERLANKLREYLTKRGLALVDDVKWLAITHPNETEDLERLRDEFKMVDRSEHPESQDEVEKPKPDRRAV